MDSTAIATPIGSPVGADRRRPWRASAAALRGAALALLVVLAGAAFPADAPAQGAPTVVIDREYTIKAAFLYHFLTYTEWPTEAASSDSPVVVGVYDVDPFGEVLDKIATSKKVNDRPIEIRRISDPAGAVGCHLLFVPESVTPERLQPILDAVADKPVLLVGESEWFVDHGGAAQFYLEGNRVRFAFNTDVVDDKNLKVSSKLLSLAKIVSTRQTSR